jgi:hypothetical protein
VADVLRIRRRAAGGSAAAPASLFASELAYNEQSDILYYGRGNSGGVATAVVPIAGPGAYLPLIGGSVSGGIDFGAALAPGGPTDLSRHISLWNGQYGFSVTSPSRLNYVGGSHVFMTGGTDRVTINSLGITMTAGNAITLAQDPTSALQAATKQYVDAGISSAPPGEAPNTAFAYARKGLAWAVTTDYTRVGTDSAFDLNSISGSGAGPFTSYQGVYSIINQTAGVNFPPGVTACAVLNLWHSNAGWPTQLAFSNIGMFGRWVTAAGGNYNAWQKVITDAGGTFSGAVTLAADPTTALQAATKQYADTKLPLIGGTVTGTTSFGTNTTSVMAIFNGPSASQRYISFRTANVQRWIIGGNTTPETGTGNVGTDFGIYRYADDGSFLGSSLVFARSSGLGLVAADPTSPLGIATKQYVDAAGVTSFNTRTGAITLTSADVSGASGLLTSGGIVSGPLTIGTNTVAQPLNLNGPAGSAFRDLYWQTAGVARWRMRPNITAESGGNTGCDLELLAFDDSGVVIGTYVARFTRSTGLITLGNGGLSFGSLLAPGGVTDFSQHIALFGTTYGINVTSSRLNIVSGASIFFVSNGVDKVTVNSLGLTMQSGTTLTLAADPTTAMQAATKQYVDAGVTSFNTRTGAVVLNSADMSAATALGGLSIGSNTAAQSLFLNGPAASSRILRWQTAGVARWQLSANGTAEAGGNAGTDLDLFNYDDSGAVLLNPAARFSRSTGILTLNGGLLLGANANVSFGSTLASSTTDLSKHIALWGTSYGFSVTGGRMNIVAGTAVFVSGGTDVATITTTGIAANTPTQLAGTETTALANTQFVSRLVGAFAATAITDADQTLTAAQVGNGRIVNITGTLTADRTITMPLTGQQKSWIIRNGTTGGFNIIVTAGGATTFSIPVGYEIEFWTNGVNLFPTHVMFGGLPTRFGDATRNALLINPGLASAACTVNVSGTGPLQFLVSPTAPTPATADSSTTLATTAFVKAQAYATLASPTFTGTPLAPTAATATNTTQIATTAYVKAQGYAPLAAPVLTGAVQVTGAASQLSIIGGASSLIAMTKTASGQANVITGSTGAASQRWAINLGDTTTESGSNAGSDFSIARYTDAGVLNGTAFLIARATGNATVTGNFLATGTVSGNGAYINTSDRRLKQDIADTDLGLKEIMRLRPVSFRRKRMTAIEFGFVAQELRDVIPAAVGPTDDSEDPMLGIMLDPIVAALVNGMKALAARVQQLEGRTIH